MKKCITCCKEMELSEFINRKDSKDGKGNKCKLCRKEYDKLYRNKNSDKLSKRNKKYRLINKEKYQEYDKNYYSVNKEKLKAKSIEYAKNNKEIRNKNKVKRRNNDPLYKIAYNVGSSIRSSIKERNYTKRSRTYEIVGCSNDFLKGYLEAKFENWMNWNNHGLYNGILNYGWDIDHIIPTSTAKNEEELLKLLHYTNLQPLCSKTNRDVKKAIY